ncbi:MAG: hypothetical protein IKV59_06950 [Lachnospiraceae bacterium]|nr:hypothetical protein [Lachnospiraceae bacterium]
MNYRKKLCLIAFIGSGLSIGCMILDQNSGEEIRILERPERGTDSVEKSLQLELGGRRYPFTVMLQAMPYREEEVQELLSLASEGLEELFLMNNTDLSHILTNVSMPSVYPNTQVDIQWYLDSWELIEPDGTVRNETLENTESVNIQAVLSMENQTVTWERELKVCPLENFSVEQKLQLLEYDIRMHQAESDNSQIVLPTSVNGEVISWHGEQERRWIWLAGLTVLTLCAVAIGNRQDEEKERKRWERGMELDYAEIVSRLSLYMGAGISTRKAWERILENYQKTKRQNTKCRPAYEEMRTTLYEMQSGIPEALAYERFGTRCRIPCYLKLGTLLSQNLRKGTKGLAFMLQEESKEAFQDRKALAKKLGEECESKLLLPMFLMLLTVLIMVMYPAVVSFQM